MTSVLFPHIWLDVDEGRTVLTVEDTELFDLVEDHLLENFDLRYEWVQVERHAGLQRYRMTFPVEADAAAVTLALNALDPAELERVFLLNNSTSAGAAVPSGIAGSRADRLPSDAAEGSEPPSGSDDPCNRLPR